MLKGKVLIDNGSTLNTLLRHMLREIHINEFYMRPYTMTMRAYNSSPRQILETPNEIAGDGYQSFLKYIIGKTIDPCSWSNNLLNTPMPEIYYK